MLKLQPARPDQRDAADTVQPAPQQIRTICTKNNKDADIIILTETWCRNDALTYCPSGYYEVIGALS